MQDEDLFLKEISIMKKLSHPYIVRYLGAGVMRDKETGKPFIAVVRSCALRA